jgi:pimeloyl-ACP methyl ester carboxylesterase
MAKLASTVSGDGPEVLLIHGGMTDGALAWGAQAPLAERWTLRVVDRAGYGASASLSEGEDIELDARLIAASLTEPVHLVGHSSGAIVALLAAALAPDLVRSLTVVEPPSYRFVADPAVQALADGGDTLWDATHLSDQEWLHAFFDVYGEGAGSDEILELLAPHVHAFRGFVRRPYDIELPVEALQNAGFPIMVVSGGHTDSFELLNDRIAEAVGATRAVVEGAGHEVQMTGAPFNEVVDQFCRAAEPAA